MVEIYTDDAQAESVLVFCVYMLVICVAQQHLNIFVFAFIHSTFRIYFVGLTIAFDANKMAK